jgi:hypothetical protein
MRQLSQLKGRYTMPKVHVVPAEKGRFKVLVNFIQQGVEYATQEQAEKEAKKIRDWYTEG